MQVTATAKNADGVYRNHLMRCMLLNGKQLRMMTKACMSENITFSAMRRRFSFSGMKCLSAFFYPAVSKRKFITDKRGSFTHLFFAISSLLPQFTSGGSDTERRTRKTANKCILPCVTLKWATTLQQWTFFSFVRNIKRWSITKRH